MGSRRKTESDDVRLPELSRRAALAGTSVAAFVGAKSAAASAPPFAPVLSTPDEEAKLFGRWLALDAEIERLQTRWAKLESWLAREKDWLQLSPTQQQALPWAKELRDIDGCLDVLIEQREALLDSIPPSGSIRLESVVAKLAVVQRLIWPEEHPEAHALITGARQDLIAMSREPPDAAVSENPTA